jgi:hypothetical protein
MRTLLLAFTLAAAGCGQLLGLEDPVAAVDAAGAEPDGAVHGGAVPRQELATAAGVVRGGGYTLSVQLGHATAQRPVAGQGYTLESAAAVAP